MTTTQMKRFREMIEDHAGQPLTETLLAQYIANYNSDATMLRILIDHSNVSVVMCSPFDGRIQGDTFVQGYSDKESKVEAMLRAMGFVMLHGQRNNSTQTFTFSFG